MSDSESDFILSSEGEDEPKTENEEEEEEEVYYSEEVREKLFNCSNNVDVWPSENSQTKQKRVRKESTKERPKSLQQYYQEQKKIEEEKNKGKRKWRSSRVRNRKFKEGKDVENDKPIRKFNPRRLPYPPPLSSRNNNRNRRNTTLVNVNIDDSKSFPKL